MLLKYFKNNAKVLTFLCLLVLVSGPTFSFVLTKLESLLNKELGDWLSFYGTISGVVISLLVIHFQLFIDDEKELVRHRPELSVGYEYQLIKSESLIYFNDKKWFSLLKQQNQRQFVEHGSFYRTYVADQKMDKALSIIVLNNQPIFNVHIVFGETTSCEIIPKLEANQRIYIISEEHLRAIRDSLATKTNKNGFQHVPNQITIYYTTLVGEKNSRLYEISQKGICTLSKESFGVRYPDISKNKSASDYFIYGRPVY